MLIVHPAETRSLAIPFALYIVGLSYIRSVRYLVVRRPDQSYRSQLITFALAPLSSLLNVYLCSILQYAGLATFLKTGWSTRAHVEVSIGEAPDLAPATVIGVEGTDPDDTTPMPRAEAPTVQLAKLLDPLTDATLEMRLPGREGAA